MKHAAPRERGSRVYDALTLYAPIRGVVVLLALGLVGWGIWVGVPVWDTFDNPIYELMADLATENVWAVLFLFSGGSMLWGALDRDIEWIRRGAFMGAALWLVVAVFVGISQITATPVVTLTLIALLHAWIYLQVKIHPEIITGEITMLHLKEVTDKNGRPKD